MYTTTSRVSRLLPIGGGFRYRNYIMSVCHVVVVVHDDDMSTVALVLPVWFG